MGLMQDKWMLEKVAQWSSRRLVPCRLVLCRLVLYVGIAIGGWIGSSGFLFPANSYAQPPMREHTATRALELRRIRASQELRFEPIAEMALTESERIIKVNGIPEHPVGQFPNRGNPHAIRPVEKTYRVTLNPEQERRAIPVGMNNFGVALNGVLFDPAAAEFYRGNPRLGWQYDALGGAVPLGLDENEAHVQPDGNYHYHGLPRGFLKRIGLNSREHSPLIGWAADGFPIYAKFGYSDPEDAESEIVELKSSYKLKEGRRPAVATDRRGPTGRHDGAFVNDYEFESGLGDLDECNGRFTITPDFPNGTYAYFLTESWPVVPRMYRGQPDDSFVKRRGAGPGPGGAAGRRGPPRRPGRGRDE